MKVLLPFALCGMMLLAGCGSTLTNGLTPSLSPSAQLAAEKVYAGGDIAYHVAGSAYEAVRVWLPADAQARCIALSAQALDALHAAKAALTLGDIATLQAKIDAINVIRDQITAITAPVAAAHGAN